LFNSQQFKKKEQTGVVGVETSAFRNELKDYFEIGHRRSTFGRSDSLVSGLMFSFNNSSQTLD
jgi:hypothetical protein